MNQTYKKYKERFSRIADINASISVMNWDQEVNMPKKGGAFRARQISTLSGMAHDMWIDDQTGDILHRLLADASLSPEQVKNVNESLKDFNKKSKLPTSFVVERSKAISNAFEAWMKAREANDYLLYKAPLQKIIEMKREEAEILGYREHPYDALLDEYEPYERAGSLDVLFKDVKSKLSTLLDKIKGADQVDNDFMRLQYDKDRQWEFGLQLLRQMGYDFDAGRQDVSPHPFTITFNPLDVRVTTRVDAHDLCNMTWSCIHEGGHALYEQGLEPEGYGLPSGQAISLGIHESQSRLWENNVGRALHYWKANYPKLQQMFPENLKQIDLESFYKAMNKVQSSFIRTESDELTYHFHILIRYELEKALIEKSLHVDDLKTAWNEKYKTYLGVDVPSDNKGILQDIHWSHGSIGYFPTYSLGSFYASQFYDQAVSDIPNLESEIAEGNMCSLLGWLRENIHQHGRLYTANELCEKVTGEKLDVKHFMQYAEKKYTDIYQL